MDEGARDVAARAGRDPTALQDEVDGSRERLGALVEELERRGRRVAVPLLLGAAAVVALAVTSLWLSRRRQRRGRARELGALARRVSAHPERFATERPSLARKLLTSAGASFASVAGRAAARRWVAPSSEDR
jgi:hypothetical protein